MALTLWGICQTLVFFLQCTPLESTWNPAIKGLCLPNRLAVGFASSAINIFTDLAIAALPIPVIWQLNLRCSQKILLSGVFGLGCFSIALAIIRLKWAEIGSRAAWDTVRPALWSLAEVSSAIVCACIPTFKPLLVRINELIPRHEKGGGNVRLQDQSSDGDIESNVTSVRSKEGFSHKHQERQEHQRPVNNLTYDGLVRQETGTLFPYNPEFYDRATGLYGPGAIYCWYFLLASVLASWFFCIADQDGSKKPGVSTDLLGALAYPAFAATDLLVQSIRMIGVEHRALAIFCLRFPMTELRTFGPFNTTQLDLNHIPPDILDLGQRTIDITGPLTICYTAASFLLLLIILFVLPAKSWMRSWSPNSSARWIICAAYGYISLMLVIFHLSLGDLFISLILVVYEAMLPIELTMTYLFTVGFSIMSLSSCVRLLWGMKEKKSDEVVEALKAVGGCILGVAMLVVPSLLIIHWDHISTIPDLAIRVSERDQLATLIVGAVTLAFTLFDVCRRFYGQRGEREADEEEMQMLPTEEA
ncbi:hypothetical protein FSARC_2928 [Fusarium sarcochroum]|uniref:Rhodopsin domain-containing protein n=1 Tax=Fusarium sarcochroum TaxID=1208366 RepID=A0A8H4U5F2_9HYPO|nr:hypothetical protein FSARC_2928 [Fusarium sarcochroum]